jgi:Flp pilus assembly protein TadD
MMKKNLSTLCIFWALSLSCMARDVTAELSPPEWFTKARQAIEVKNYDLAIHVLTQADEKQSADWHNLMGFSLRSKTPIEREKAEQHYKAALEKNPMHLGALEYYGELLLLKNDLRGAETLLKRLEKICPAGCEELSDLQKSLANFKAKKQPTLRQNPIRPN